MSNTLQELIDIRRKLPPVDRNSIKSSLCERFLLPPFTVLDARQGYWQKRKKMWLSLGGVREIDEDSNLINYSARTSGITDPQEIAEWNLRRRKSKEIGGTDGRGLLGISSQARSQYKNEVESKTLSGTSVFDPVLCEAMYRWFCPKGGKVLDPFAGGDMQGIVAGCIGRSYYGVDLRAKQVEANRKRKEIICPEADVKWVIGDSCEIWNLLPGRYDFILSNPPYADLEVYSNDSRDLSTLDYKHFLEKYRRIVRCCCDMLKDNRFAFFLVGDVRDKKEGDYYNFVSHTISAFIDAGLKYYNEAILVTSIGSLPIRVGSMFKDYRKMGKAHQNVLVFLKGDAEIACAECGEVDIDDLEMPDPCVPGMIALEDMPNEVIGIGSIPLIEVCLNVDIIRCKAIADGKPIPRTWLGTVNGWQRLQDLVELTYIVDGIAYLNREVFPDAPVPPISKPPVKTIRRGRQ